MVLNFEISLAPALSHHPRRQCGQLRCAIQQMVRRPDKHADVVRQFYPDAFAHDAV